jgi:hypothetical protein
MLWTSILYRISKHPQLQRLWQHIPVGSVEQRVFYGGFRYPYYAFGVYSAASLAKALGIDTISVAEFGVAGGRGLLALEYLAKEIGSELGVSIIPYGFDSGEGMPDPVDYRDLVHVWSKGDYKMDEQLLRSRLRTSRLVLGDVRDTIPKLLEEKSMPTLGFISFDLDFYSSTMNAFHIFESEHSARLPRIFCYFDDVVYPLYACYCEYTGELLAIREFNEHHESLKICRYHLLRHYFPHPSAWHDQYYVLHDIHHPLYTRHISPEKYRGLPL